ncbi:MAG: hypothetical protein IK058_02010 [Bacteroidales bacterium]|nr:hypothetical protein [Bacteroidales bacterium]
MRRLANITTTLTALIILVFCGGGVSMTKCACTGKVSLLKINNSGCCPSEGGCMTVTTLHVSESDLTDGVDMPQMMPASLPSFEVPISTYPGIHREVIPSFPADIAPPGISQCMVMRV